jgi:aryl-alcohol dehydrogenase-like predicted oxidoreductase
MKDFPEDDYRRHSPRFQGENFRKNLDLVAKVTEIAQEKHCTPAQLALAWVLSQGNDIAPIPGTKKRKYLEENLKSLDVHLSTEDLARIGKVASRGAAAGNRYPEGMSPPKYTS